MRFLLFPLFAIFPAAALFATLDFAFADEIITVRAGQLIGFSSRSIRGTEETNFCVGDLQYMQGELKDVRFPSVPSGSFVEACGQVIVLLSRVRDARVTRDSEGRCVRTVLLLDPQNAVAQFDREAARCP